MSAKPNIGFFEEAFKEVIKIEKGYVNSEFDRGGETKFGISKKTYPELDIANLTWKKQKLFTFMTFGIVTF